MPGRDRGDGVLSHVGLYNEALPSRPHTRPIDTI